MINPVYQQMVVRVVNQQLMPMTTDRKLTYEDMQVLANQSASMPEPVISAVNFLLNTFDKISLLGDTDNTSISEQDVQAFAQNGLDLRA
jgi:hypothetical protein